MTELKNNSQTVILISSDGKRGIAIIEILKLNKFQRILRSVWRGILLLTLSALSIAIPMLHFILVPIGLLITLVVSYSAFQVKEILVSGSGQCPSCNNNITIHQRNYKLPFSDVCEHCGRQLTIKL